MKSAIETAAFRGKGSARSDREAIYASAIRLRRGEAYRRTHESVSGSSATLWQGDVVAPLIRDLGAALAMRPTRETVRGVLNAQMGKAGPPMNGRDLHVGDFDWGILPAAAPLAIPTLMATGMAMGFQREGLSRIAVSFVGEGATSLGEWHEADQPRRGAPPSGHLLRTEQPDRSLHARFPIRAAFACSRTRPPGTVFRA